MRIPKKNVFIRLAFQCIAIMLLISHGSASSLVSCLHSHKNSSLPVWLILDWLIPTKTDAAGSEQASQGTLHNSKIPLAIVTKEEHYRYILVVHHNMEEIETSLAYVTSKSNHSDATDLVQIRVSPKRQPQHVPHLREGDDQADGVHGKQKRSALDLPHLPQKEDVIDMSTDGKQRRAVPVRRTKIAWIPFLIFRSALLLRVAETGTCRSSRRISCPRWTVWRHGTVPTWRRKFWNDSRQGNKLVETNAKNATYR